MLSILLAPFSWLYGAVMWVRNFLYDNGWKKCYSFDQAIIVVGNLSVGGTGKTPMIEYLVRLLHEKYFLAILSRGYGRSTRGFRWANENDDASSIGDEPFQLFQKFKGHVPIIVSEDRVVGIREALRVKSGIQVFLLDDAFQHRSVRPTFSILLTDFSKPFFKDFILPQGRLREARVGGRRSDVVVVTKCLELNDDLERSYRNQIQSFVGDKPIFFSEIVYDVPVAFGESELMREIILVSGIANSSTLINYVSTHFNFIYHFVFTDHYEYSQKDILEIEQMCLSKNASIITTEKDKAKLINLNLNKKLWFYLPIQSHFINNGSEFDTVILKKIENYLSQ